MNQKKEVDPLKEPLEWLGVFFVFPSLCHLLHIHTLHHPTLLPRPLFIPGVGRIWNQVRQ